MEETFKGWLKENFIHIDGCYVREDTEYIYDVKILEKNFNEGKNWEGCGEVRWIGNFKVRDLLLFKNYCNKNNIKPTFDLFNKFINK